MASFDIICRLVFISESNWRYRLHNKDFENSRKRFRCSTTDDLSNRNQNRTLSMSERICHISNRLEQYLSPCYTIKTDWVMAIAQLSLLLHLVMSAMTLWVHNTQLHQNTYMYINLYTCKILLVWHQFFIAKSSGQTPYQTNTTNHRVKTISPRYRYHQYRFSK